MRYGWGVSALPKSMFLETYCFFYSIVLFIQVVLFNSGRLLFVLMNEPVQEVGIKVVLTLLTTENVNFV